MRNEQQRIVALLIGLGLVHGLLYAAIIYPWQAPDENWHFEYARLVYESGAWKAQPFGRALTARPARSPEVLGQLLDSMERFHFWELIPWAVKGQVSGGLLYQPPLYYWLGALTLYLIPGADIVTQLYVLRLFSVLLGTVTILLTYLTVRALFPEEPFLQIAAPAFVLLLPMHTYMAGSVNNDNLAEALAALAIYFLTLSFQKGLSLVRVAAVALALALGFYAKRTVFSLVPLTLLAIPLALWIRPPRLARWQKLAGIALLDVTLVVAVILWWEGSLSRWWEQLYRNLVYTGSYPDLLSMLRILPKRIPDYAQYLFKSFWAYFGWLTIELRPPWYTVILAVCLVVLLGLARFGFRVMRGSVQLVPWQKAALLLYVLSVFLVISLTVATFLLYEVDDVFAASARGAQPQGRYLFPAIVPIAILFALGLRELIPQAYQLPALLSYLMALFVFDGLTLGGYIIPYFYGGLATLAWRPGQAGQAPQTALPTDTATPEASPTAASASSPGLTTRTGTLPPFGVQLLAREYDPQVFDQLRNIGAQWVRVYLDWSRVEPVNATPDGYRWEIYDIFLAQIVKSDLIPIVTVEGNPKWAATSYRGPIDKVPLAEFAEFMKALVSRYQGPPYNVKYWELYNEPDDWEVHPWDGSRGAWGGKGAEYAEMLKVIWPAVHEADPDAKVVLGGIAYTSWSACHPCFDLDFLDDIVESGGAPYFDVLNFHYYPRLEIGKWAPPNLLGKALALRDQLPPELRDKPIMCTEVGEAYEGDPQDPPYSHELASGFLVQALVQSLAAREYGLDFLASTWFSLETYDLGSHKFGLLDPDLNPLPGYRAFQVVARELAGAEYQRRLVQPGIEGYVFSLSGGGEPVLAVRPGWPGTGKAVLWAVGEPVAYTFSGAQLRAVDKYGAESVINDGGSGDRDGTVNGSITIEITRSPTYIEWGS